MSVFRRRILASYRSAVAKDIAINMIISDGTNFKGAMSGGKIYSTMLQSGRSAGRVYLPKGSGIYCFCSDVMFSGAITAVQYSSNSSAPTYSASYDGIYRGTLIDTSESGAWVMIQHNSGTIYDAYLTQDFEKYYLPTTLASNTRINVDTSTGNYKIGNHTGDTRASAGVYANYQHTALHIDENPICPAWNGSAQNKMFHALTGNKDQVVTAFTDEEIASLKSSEGFRVTSNAYNVFTCNSTTDGVAESIGVWYYRKKQ